MRLRHFELRVAFGAGQNLAFFDLVFVQIDFSIAFRASGHGHLSCAAFLHRTAYYITPVPRFLARMV
jgi:hypothetical protein